MESHPRRSHAGWIVAKGLLQRSAGLFFDMRRYALVHLLPIGRKRVEQVDVVGGAIAGITAQFEPAAPSLTQLLCSHWSPFENRLRCDTELLQQPVGSLRSAGVSTREDLGVNNQKSLATPNGVF